MKLKIFFFILCILPSLSRSQDNLIIAETDSSGLIDYFLEFEKSEKRNKDWVESLTEKGVSSDDKEIFFSEEGIKLLNDSLYRVKIYKDKYSLYDVGVSLSNMDIKLAFWQMINIYPQKRDTLIQYIYAYDKILPVDEIVLASFYTYAFFDPRITKINTGRPEVYRPDIFEEYFRRAKEIVYYLNYLRRENNEL
ncbi:MAG: hypothetical protein CMB81_02430 [Flammeovirgaceae bacterium]|nr:hypothetical protein [Flammeovirgaceae bacterium]